MATARQCLKVCVMCAGKRCALGDRQIVEGCVQSSAKVKTTCFFDTHGRFSVMNWIMVAETHWRQQCSRHGEVLATTQLWDPHQPRSRETKIGPSASWEAAVAVSRLSPSLWTRWWKCTGLWDFCIISHLEHVHNCLRCAGFRQSIGR